MSVLVVGVGDFKYSSSANDVIKTYALGSCVGVIFLVPRQRLAALLHIALPESKINPELAAKQLGMFADTGIPAVINQLAQHGCTPSGMVIKIAGGASILDAEQHFEIGKRNILAVKKILWRYKLGPVSEDIGDSYSRTVSVAIETGKVFLSSPGKGEWEI